MGFSGFLKTIVILTLESEVVEEGTPEAASGNGAIL